MNVKNFLCMYNFIDIDCGIHLCVRLKWVLGMEGKTSMCPYGLFAWWMYTQLELTGKIVWIDLILFGTPIMPHWFIILLILN
jgi:hypothetical protein